MEGGDGRAAGAGSPVSKALKSETGILCAIPLIGLTGVNHLPSKSGS